MISKLPRHSRSIYSNGFTLIELMVVISVIGILALVAMPSYKRYVNEAKAADILNQIHTITLAYQDVIATVPNAFNKPDELSSPNFGLPPTYLPGLASQFSEKYSVEFSAQLVNHTGFFSFTGHEAFPVLFLKASDRNGIDMLNALDHVTKLKHTFITPGMMMIALASPYESHRAAGQTTGQTAGQTTGQTAGQTTGQTAGQTTGQTAEQTKPDQQAQSQTSAPRTSPCNLGFHLWPPAPGQQYGTCRLSPPPATATSNSGSTQSNAGSHLNWPPGWVKHPERHQNQHHGNH